MGLVKKAAALAVIDVVFKVVGAAVAVTAAVVAIRTLMRAIEEGDSR